MDVNIWLGVLVYCLTILEISLIFIYGINHAREPYAKGNEAIFQFRCQQRAIVIVFVLLGTILGGIMYLSLIGVSKC